MAELELLDPPPVREFPTILLVEDNESILALFSEALRQEGFNVLTASTVQDALGLAANHPGTIHLMVTDLLLPSKEVLQVQKAHLRRAEREMNGLDLMRQVIVNRPEMQILLMSGRPDKELQALGVFREGKPLLRKPLRLETLVHTVHQILERVNPS